MKRLLCYALLCMAFFACKPDISVNQDFDIPSDKALLTTSDVENALQSTFAILRSEDCYGGAWLVWPEIMTDNFQLSLDYAGPLPERNIFNRILLPNDSLIVKTWKAGYRAIALTNAIIESLEKGKFDDVEFEKNKNRFAGEAYFLRAISHFELLRLFAPQYSEETKNSPAIPVYTRYYPTITPLERSTVDQAYTQILADLNTSIQNLTQAGIFKYYPLQLAPLGTGFEIFNRPTVDIARSFKARVLMQTGQVSNYSNAITEINQVIEDRSADIFRIDSFDLRTASNPLKYYPNDYPLFGSILNTWEKMFTNNVGKDAQTTHEGNYEFIFSIMNYRNDNKFTNKSRFLASFFSMNKENPFFNTTPPFAVPAQSGTRLFSSGLLDKRVKSFLIGNAKYYIRIKAGITPAFNKFNYFLFNVPIQRSADLLLLRAEANLALGKPSNAIYDLMYVKYRSNAATLDLVNRYYRELKTNADFAGFLQNEIIRERRREFLAEGDRLHTLRRTRTDIPASDRGPGIPWNSPSLIFPIPVTETSVNSKIN